MKTKFKGFLTLLLVFVVQITFAQEKTVSGTVVDESNMPLPGATVLIKNTATGVSTDFDGNYSIEAKQGDVLTFSFVGYKNQSVTVGSSNSVNVNMDPDNSLDEVLIEAAYDIKKAKPLVNTAVQVISSETIENRPNTSLLQTLQGQVAGLNITTSNGQPGAVSDILIRGIGSLSGSTQPLFVIDGIPSDQTAFRALNPNDIASFVTLKDAGATAIYGNRGSNGVILVTTKGGKYNSDFKVNYTAITSVSRIQEPTYDLMNSGQQLRLERLMGVGRGVGLGDSEIDAINAQVNTDWVDVFFRDAFTSTHTLNFSSGGENVKSFSSLGYTDQEGIVRTSGLKRFNFRNNTNGKSSNGKFTYGTNISLNLVTQNRIDQRSGVVNQNYVVGAYGALPHLSPDQFVPGTGIPLFTGFNSTPFLLMDKLQTAVNKRDEVRVLGGLNGNYKLTDKLTVGSRFGVDYLSRTNLLTTDPSSFNGQFFADNDPSNPGQRLPGGMQDQSLRRDVSYNVVNSLTYSTTIKEKHTLNAGIYTEYFKAHRRSFGFRQNGLDSKTFYPGDGSGFISDVTAHDSFVDTVRADNLNSGLFSYFGNLDYDYNRKYGFTATLRRDASSRFTGDNQWGTFYAVSGRWNIDQESFMDNTKMNLLKLRASYGETGNQQISGTSNFSALNNTQDLYATGGGYGGANSIIYGQIGNDQLRWETAIQTNIGLDFGAYNNRISGTLDVYNKKSEGLFTAQPIQAIAGVTSLFKNQGEITNKGVELLLRYQLIKNDNDGLNIGLMFNGSYNEATRTGANLENVEEGGKLFQYNVVRYAGVNPANGSLLFYDINGNITETPDVDNDRVFTDRNRLPDYQGGFGVNGDYKGFFFETQFNYAIGVDRFDFDYSGLVDPNGVGNFRSSTDLLNAWTPSNTATNIPSLTASNLTVIGAGASDRFIQNADYLRLRFVSFGYSFNKETLKRFKLSNLKIFVNGENLLTFSKWQGYDVEGVASTQDAFPTARVVSAGLEIGF